MTGRIRVLIAASGTGGHIFPAIFIARKILEASSDNEILFVGSGRPLEAKLIDGNGFQREIIPIVGLRNYGIFSVLKTLFFAPKAFLSTWKIFSSFKPQVVIGVGGYVSFMPVLIAYLKGIPTWIHEAEMKAGVSNRILAFFASKISLAFENCKIPCRRKAIFTGHPIREDLKLLVNKPFDVEKPFRILVTGGSLGAKALDDAMTDLSHFLNEHEVEVLHQCRPENVDSVSARYASQRVKVLVEPFIDNMVEAFEWAHIIISRSGAGAIMELGVVGKPCILVPFPHSQAGEQKANAMILFNQGKALLCEEGENFTERLRHAISELLDPSKYKAMLSKTPDRRSLTTAHEIAKGCLGLVERK